MDYYTETIKSMLDNMIQVREEYQLELRRCPEGSLWKAENNGRPSYFWATREGDLYIRRGISRDKEMQRQLARKAYLRKSVKLLDQNIYRLRRTLDGLEPLDTSDVIRGLSRAYQELPGDYFLSPAR